MKREEFREYAHVVADWMADYLEGVEALPVMPQTSPGEVSGQLPLQAPESGEPFEALMKDFRELIVPHMTHWNHPRFFGYFPANTSPPSILAEMLTAAMGAQCMSWQTSPAATELEGRVMEWLRQLLALPQGWTGVIQDTASTSTLTALLCAREKATGWGFYQHGAATNKARDLRVYTSQEAHSSVDKAVILAGYGRENLRRIATDETFALDACALEKAIKRDLEAGLCPAAVVATIGTTGSTAIDPIPAIGEICNRHEIWLHVDAALAGTAALLEEKRGLFRGLEEADSFVFNPHKWLFTNFDCSAYYVKDPQPLLRTMSTDPEYLKTTHDAQVNNYRDWGIPLGRRFRSLKLWFVLRSYGREGLQARVRRHLELASTFAQWVRESRDWELAAPVPLNLVTFRFQRSSRGAGPLSPEAQDDLNAAILKEVNESGRCMLTHTRLAGRYTLRLSVGQTETQARHVQEVWDLLNQVAHTQLPGA